MKIKVSNRLLTNDIIDLLYIKDTLKRKINLTSGITRDMVI